MLGQPSARFRPAPGTRNRQPLGPNHWAPPHPIPAPSLAMPTDNELAAAYRAWWFDSYKHPPNAAAVATATHWARHVLATYGANQWKTRANP
jgi:hypothetical protein